MTVGTIGPHKLLPQLTGIVTHVPFSQTLGLQGSVLLQPVQVVLVQLPMGWVAHCPVFRLHESKVQELLSLQIIGTLKQPPELALQIAVEHKSNWPHTTGTMSQFPVVALQAALWHKLVG